MAISASAISGHFNQTDPGKTTLDHAREAYGQVRSATERFSLALSPEDQNLQSMPDASPIKWHRAHTTWFFETFLLKPHLQGYRCFDQAFAYLFNSYYNGIGAQFPRAQRGLISRPGVEDVSLYRAHVDQAMSHLLNQSTTGRQRSQLMALLVLGLNHEQQHQELMVTDLKHAFSLNPSWPAIGQIANPVAAVNPMGWLGFDGGLVQIGATGRGFHFDNEGPRHSVYLMPFQIATRPVNCGEFLDFIEDDGYRRPELWLSDGWAWVNEQRISAPLYWYQTEEGWELYTLGGRRALNPAEPATHLSFYEACAYAEWAEARLPSEAEWEHACSRAGAPGTMAEDGYFHPSVSATSGDGLDQMLGGVWEWTRSSYAPYPGFRPAAGAVGEYNGKFMANQMVLRGGSCATPAGHIRPSYRNFFYPGDRWQFSGIRLARDLAA